MSRYIFVSVYLSLIVLQINFDYIHGDEVFTAQADMKPLLNTESSVLRIWKEYLDHEERRLEMLQQLYNEYLIENKIAIQDKSDYLLNPINIFKIIKRLTIDWSLLKEYLIDELGTDLIANMTLLETTVLFPTHEDLVGASIALVRLQETYKLTTSDVAQGILNNVKYSYEMSASDCFEVGLNLFESHYDVYANKWMMQALNKYNIESKKTIQESVILKYLVDTSYSIGDVKSALIYTLKLLNLNPDDQTAEDNRIKFEKILMDNNTVITINLKTPMEGYLPDDEKEIYEGLCREELEPPESIKKHLKCRYIKNTHPFLRIAPLKLEEHYLDPYIVVYHDVLHDKEIEYIKQTALPRFKRASVVDEMTGKSVPTNYRISKSAWLGDSEHPMLKRISQRTEMMTSLTVLESDSLQVVNYGIGGHYLPHVDYVSSAHNNVINKEKDNNVIATVLFYLSDVAQGGGTVFPELGIAVRPTKGTAVFWMNLHPSGEGNGATKHAACPVLQGSKWVSNKWIHQKGQEFLKPCSLEYQPEGMLKKYPAAVKKKKNGQ